MTTNLGGRPAIYTKEVIENEALALEKYIQEGKFIWFERFCEDRGYTPDRMTEWAENNERFHQAYKLAKAKQKNMLVENGLLKTYNYNMVALLLGHSWGMVAKTEQKLSGDKDNPLHGWIAQANGKTEDLVNEESIS